MAVHGEDKGKSRFMPTAISPDARIFIPDGRADVLSGAQSLKAGEFFAFAVAQDSAQPLEVGRHYRQRHRAGKSPVAMVTYPVQPTVFQMIDRRLNTRVLLTGVLEPLLRLMRHNPGARATSARQCTFIQQLTQISLIGRWVKAAVETAAMQVSESLPGFGNHRHCMVQIVTAPHDAMLQDKLVLVLHHTHRYAEFLRHACLAFGNPAGMRLKDRKHLLVVGNVLTLKQAACVLINLAMRMCDIVLQQQHPGFLKYHG